MVSRLPGEQRPVPSVRSVESVVKAASPSASFPLRADGWHSVEMQAILPSGIWNEQQNIQEGMSHHEVLRILDILRLGILRFDIHRRFRVLSEFALTAMANPVQSAPHSEGRS